MTTDPTTRATVDFNDEQFLYDVKECFELQRVEDDYDIETMKEWMENPKSFENEEEESYWPQERYEICDNDTEEQREYYKYRNIVSDYAGKLKMRTRRRRVRDGLPPDGYRSFDEHTESEEEEDDASQSDEKDEVQSDEEKDEEEEHNDENQRSEKKKHRMD